jgi:hypothetical protein
MSSKLVPALTRQRPTLGLNLLDAAPRILETISQIISHDVFSRFLVNRTKFSDPKHAVTPVTRPGPPC